MMAVKITKDTYAFEEVSPGVRIRRRVFAGHTVPDHYQLQSGKRAPVPPSPSGEPAAPPKPAPPPITGRGRQRRRQE